MSRRSLLLAAACLLALAAPASARYVTINGAPGFGPARYAKVGVDRLGPRKPRQILVLIPGTFGGSGSLRGIAEELVDRVDGLAVWSIDRRSNVLEDTSYMLRAKRGEITNQQLFDYYLGWLGMNPPPQPHYQPLADADYPFARGWGLETAMEDTRRVVLAARRTGADVVLGGHSLGASSVYAYAAWDFKGRPGYRDLTGLVAIDGGGLGAAADLASIQAQIDELNDGSPWLDLLDLGLPWTSGVFQETGAIAALTEPDAPSVGQASPLLPAQFKPDVPVTNEALFGYAFDHRTSPAALAVIHVHSGQIDRGGAEPHGWRDDGITPVQRLARLAAHEPGNFVEWYYPRRLTIDVSAARSLRRDEANDAVGNRLWHTFAVDVPLYAFQTSLTGGRVLRGARAFARASQVPYTKLVDRADTYAHLDPVTAAPKRNDFLRTVIPFLRRLR